MTLELMRQLVESSLEFGYNAHVRGMTLEQAKHRYDQLMTELLAKWEQEKL